MVEAVACGRTDASWPDPGGTKPDRGGRRFCQSTGVPRDHRVITWAVTWAFAQGIGYVIRRPGSTESRILSPGPRSTWPTSAVRTCNAPRGETKRARSFLHLTCRNPPRRFPDAGGPGRRACSAATTNPHRRRRPPPPFGRTRRGPDAQCGTHRMSGYQHRGAP